MLDTVASLFTGGFAEAGIFFGECDVEAVGFWPENLVVDLWA